MNKVCSSCKIEKPISEFNFSNKEKGIYKHGCKKCTRAQFNKHYNKNKKVIVEQVVRRNKEFQEKFITWRSTLQCLNCGENDDACLDFHHLNNDEKDNNIPTLVTKGRLAVLRELKKCICVCSNCHRKIHRYGNNIQYLAKPDYLVDSFTAYLTSAKSNRVERKK